jgi:hypothetical protein
MQAAPFPRALYRSGRESLWWENDDIDPLLAAVQRTFYRGASAARRL